MTADAAAGDTAKILVAAPNYGIEIKRPPSWSGRRSSVRGNSAANLERLASGALLREPFARDLSGRARDTFARPVWRMQDPLG
jgi:hypothetical protein